MKSAMGFRSSRWLLVLFSILFIAAKAACSTEIQTWIVLCGGPTMDGAAAITWIQNGGCVVVGETDIADRGSSDMWVLKLNDAGEIEWQAVCGWESNPLTGTGLEGGHSVMQLSDGSIVAAGWTTYTHLGAPAMWVHKYTVEGDIQWQKVYGGSLMLRCAASEICELPSGNLVAVGASFAGLFSVSDLWVACLSSEGELLWQESFGGADVDGAHSVVPSLDGGCLIVGKTDSYGAGGSDIWLLKLSPEGHVEWQKTYGGNGDDTGYAALALPDHGYIIAGWTESFGSGKLDLWLLRIERDGEILWEKAYGGQDNDKGYALSDVGDGTFLVAGETDSFGAGGRDMWLLRLDERGEVLWERTYGWDKTEYGYDVDVSRYGILLAGTSHVGFKDTDACIAKLQMDGLVASDCSIIGSSNSKETLTSAHVIGTNAAAERTSAETYVTKASLFSPPFVVRYECALGKSVPIRTTEETAWDASGVANDLEYSPNGIVLATTSGNVVELRSAETYQVLHVLEGHSGDVGSVAFSRDGSILATGCKAILLWDPNTGARVGSLQGHEGWVKGLSFSPDGTILASASADQTVKLWEIATGECIRVLKGHQWYVESVAFHPSKTILASCSLDGTVRMWDAGTGRALSILSGHLGWVRDVTFSPDGLLIASGSADHTVKLWDAKTGVGVRTLSGPADEVFCVSFSPDGQLLAGGCEDGTIFVWDVSTGGPLVRLLGYRGYVAAAGFSPDGLALATVSQGGAGIVWEVSSFYGD